jgi:putative transposase
MSWALTLRPLYRKNDEARISFFELLKLKKRGRLPPHNRKVSPPGYWKDRLTGKKETHIHKER